MKRDSNKRKKISRRILMKESVESKLKKKTLKRNMNKREKLLRIQKRLYNKRILNMKGNKRFKEKNMKILRKLRVIISKLWKERFRNRLIKLMILMKHYLKVRLVQEKKLNNGKLNSMKLTVNMQIYKLKWKKRKPFGQVNLSSQRNRKSNTRKIMKMLINYSSKRLTSFKKTRKRPNLKVKHLIILCWLILK